MIHFNEVADKPNRKPDFEIIPFPGMKHYKERYWVPEEVAQIIDKDDAACPIVYKLSIDEYEKAAREFPHLEIYSSFLKALEIYVVEQVLLGDT